MPEWSRSTPYQIKSIGIKDACSAVSAAKRKFKKLGIISRVEFRTKRDEVQSVYIPSSAIKQAGLYHTISGNGLRFSEPLPEAVDSRLLCEYGRWYLCIPVRKSTCQADNQGRVVALDPGIRSFQTFFSEASCGQIGSGDFGRIQRLAVHLDDLLSRSDRKRKNKLPARKRARMRKAAHRARARIRDLVDEMHWKTIAFLVGNFDVILCPTFETSQMALKAGRKIRRKSVRSMLTFAHYRFKMRLKDKASEFGKVVIDVDEAYTSKTASWTGEMVKIGSAQTIKSGGVVVERDINGARGIFLRALVDHPEIIECR